MSGARKRGRAVAAVLAALTLAACSPLALLNGLVSDGDHRFEGGIAYGGQPRQRLDVYRPLAGRTDPRAAASPPLVVFFYGGAWSSGERGDYRFVGAALAARGALVVVPDYRLAPQSRYPAFVQDSALAVKWALDHAQRLGARACYALSPAVSNITALGSMSMTKTTKCSAANT